MQSTERRLFSVSEINALVRSLIEESYPDVAVLGEVSNFKQHSSGHLYFTLKDANSQLRAVCFRGDARRVKTDVKDGMKVVVRGRLTLYEGYGQYQIVVHDIDEAGEGELERAYRALLEQLQQEGLFDEELKKALPPYPSRIAVVTSPTGAAVRDVLSTLARRWPCAEVLVVPVHVQGPQAAPEIVRALERLAQFEGLDVIILGRGGGSLEDLWAFNEEAVARAIHRCPVPIISAVGHETDFTIADFVADVRAATPTMAAQLAVPLHDEVSAEVDARVKWLRDYIDNRLRLESTRLQEMLRSYALGRVRGKIENFMQRMDYSLDTLRRSITATIGGKRSLFERQYSMLAALNPKEILSRGYAICSHAVTGEVLRDAGAALEARTMKVTFQDGGVLTEVKERINDA
jgi:exodeoxyribonuclease VII large subunit